METCKLEPFQHYCMYVCIQPVYVYIHCTLYIVQYMLLFGRSIMVCVSVGFGTEAVYSENSLDGNTKSTHCSFRSVYINQLPHLRHLLPVFAPSPSLSPSLPPPGMMKWWWVLQCTVRSTQHQMSNSRLAESMSSSTMQ